VDTIFKAQERLDNNPEIKLLIINAAQLKSLNNSKQSFKP